MSSIQYNLSFDKRTDPENISDSGNIYGNYLDYLKNKKGNVNKTKKKKKKKKRKKKKDTYYAEDYDTEIFDFSDSQPQAQYHDSVPAQMILNTNRDSGLFLGLKNSEILNQYIGIPQGTEGNILVIGGNSSGKSAGIAKPTLRTWQGAMCVTDIKGELSDYYTELYGQGLVTRPYIVFDPLQEDGIGYDPFYFVAKDKPENLVKNIWEITTAIIPDMHTDKDPFWHESEQAILAAALLYYFKMELSFSQSVTMIMASTVTSLCAKIGAEKDETLKMFLGEGSAMKPETLASIDRGLRNKLMLFATDPYISNAFRGEREGASYFTWDDLDHCNIFLSIPEDRIEQWSGAVNLMYTQLIRHLERRPDKYSPDGADNVQTLLLMDEFARFGKLEMITSAVSTLRSKNVNICLMLQSMAQLDKIYGEYDRRIIFDNCQFQAILRANDAGTQKYLSDLIGTRKSFQRSLSENYDEFVECVGYGRQVNESREFMVYPHEFATLEDVLLLTPYGFCHALKFQLHNSDHEQLLLPAQSIFQKKCVPVFQGVAALVGESGSDEQQGNTLILQGKSMTLEETEKEEYYDAYN